MSIRSLRRRRAARTHAVVARQVRRRLGGRDDVVGGHARTSCAAATRLDRRAEVARARRPRRAPRDSTRDRCPAPKYSSGTPSRSPSTPRLERRARSRAPAPSTEVASSGSWPATAPSSSAVSRDVARERADLVERGREGDQPVARHAAVGRLDARRRRRTRPAGGSSRRCRCRARRAASPPATAAAEPPDEPPGTRVEVPRVARRLKAECSVDEPMANSSMFVLPRSTAPGLAQPRDDVASYGGTKCSRIFEPQVVRTPRRAEHVLERQRRAVQRRTAARRRGSAPRRPAAAASAWSRVTVR